MIAVMGKMNTLVIATALAAVASVAPAYADIVVIGYSLPDGNSSGDVTTDGYSYYTGPITFTVQGSNNPITVYCVDLNHDLQTPTTYAYVPLTVNGLGVAISQQTSNEIGQIANIGFAELKASTNPLDTPLQVTDDLDEAAAAQAAIWDLEYSTTSVTADSTISADITNLLGATYANNGEYALALQPVGEGWYGNASASQQMVLGVPEPAAWAMMLIGFVGLAYAGHRKGKSARTAFADA